MKIAIADRKGSYSDYWITYCEENNIPFIRVNPYDSDIINQVKDCDAFMWHHHRHCRNTRLVNYEYKTTPSPNALKASMMPSFSLSHTTI